jgi:hypothetical protein
MGEEDLPPCRLCFTGARPPTVERCRVAIDPGLEDRVLRRMQREGQPAIPETLVAFALLDVRPLPRRSSGR